MAEEEKKDVVLDTTEEDEESHDDTSSHDDAGDKGDEDTGDEEESIEDVKAKLAKAEEVANNQRIRAEKAEKKAKDANKDTSKDADTTATKSDIPMKDAMALMEAKVTEDEDIDIVRDYAALKKIPLKEALKSAAVITAINENKEKRSTAEATNTGRNRGQSSRLSDDALLNKAQTTGELPDTKEGMDRLAEARLARKGK